LTRYDYSGIDERSRDWSALGILYLTVGFLVCFAIVVVAVQAFGGFFGIAD
jgi:hypothetical protein